jgi:ribosomal protein S27E
MANNVKQSQGRDGYRLRVGDWRVYSYLEVRCLGCDMHQTVALDIFRRPKATPIHELERYMRCRDCSRLQAIHISAATNEDFGERSALDLLARRTLMLVAAIPTS